MARRDAQLELADLEQVFAALAHASRRQILLVLKFHGGRMTAGAIANRFSCRWPTTTRHLRALQKAGLVVVEKAGRERVYTLNTERLKQVVGHWLKWFDQKDASPQDAHSGGRNPPRHGNPPGPPVW
ncbi:MAG TPA: metalloregulator ArsR/SmtB family transcription factor [Isosphaeraceae bacterium]|nr:metalloregulator ArsR/SmtB family transcription factor [Isosphaeraceae bacterium]